MDNSLYFYRLKPGNWSPGEDSSSQLFLPS
uniref:Uncharacterized protein n=1 Tax=Rhizophora mucronata TaxID=61149 RepID=A0A2P2IIZ5_RHIMU